MRTFIDTDSTSNAETFRNVRLTGFLIENNAFLTVPNRRTKGMAFIVTLLWLTIVFFEDCDSHSFTSCCCNVCSLFGLKELSPNKREQTWFV